MKLNRIFMLICLVVCMFAMASVCAGDANDTIMASENSLEIGQTINDVIGVEEDTGLVSPDTSEILTSDEQTFAQLNETINGNGDNEISLNSDYKYSDGDANFKDGVVINRNNVTINGTATL